MQSLPRLFRRTNNTNVSNGETVFAVGSVVRATLKPIDANRRGKAPQFLPYNVLKAAESGQLSPLFLLQGSFVVPESFINKIAPRLFGPALGSGTSASEPAKLTSGTEAGRNDLSVGTDSSSDLVGTSDTPVKIDVETISLPDALAM